MFRSLAILDPTGSFWRVDVVQRRVVGCVVEILWRSRPTIDQGTPLPAVRRDRRLRRGVCTATLWRWNLYLHCNLLQSWRYVSSNPPVALSPTLAGCRQELGWTRGGHYGWDHLNDGMMTNGQARVELEARCKAVYHILQLVKFRMGIIL